MCSRGAMSRAAPLPPPTLEKARMSLADGVLWWMMEPGEWDASPLQVCAIGGVDRLTQTCPIQQTPRHNIKRATAGIRDNAMLMSFTERA